MFEPAAFARMERRGALEVGGWTVEKTSRLVAPRNTSRVSAGHLPILAVDFCDLMFLILQSVLHTTSRLQAHMRSLHTARMATFYRH